MKIDVGQGAQLVHPETKGVVADIRYNKDSKELEYMLDWIGIDGENHQRWFLESQLEEVPCTAKE